MEILSIQVKENLPSKVVVSRYDITLQTVYKWRKKYTKYLENYEKVKQEAEEKTLKEPDLENEHIYISDCAKRLRTLRIALNLSQQRIANILGISQALYVRLEKGYGQLNSFMIKKLYKTLGINPIYLICGESDCFLIKDIDLFERINNEQKKYNKNQLEQENSLNYYINLSILN
ncbi:helix-turn-helix domain-containing protein [Campylobacter coli]